MISKRLLDTLARESRLFHSPMHGLTHWRTVARNGLYLAQHSGADLGVVIHFAFFHDCQRENEYTDPEHGPRAAQFLKTIRQDIPLDDRQFMQLRRACAGHTHGTSTACPTLGTCWDADRLDLGRVGITPDSRYLFTEAARLIADSGDFGVLAHPQPEPSGGAA